MGRAASQVPGSSARTLNSLAIVVRVPSEAPPSVLSSVCAGMRAAPALSTATSVPARRTGRKRTYYTRKDETAKLRQEVRVLQARLELLRERTPSSDLRTGSRMHGGNPNDQDQNHQQDRDTLAQAYIVNHRLRAALHDQQLALASLNALMEHHMTHTVNPLNVFIHLSRDSARRRLQLLNLRETMIPRARAFVTRRLHGVDPHHPYSADESFLDASGQFWYISRRIIHIPGARNVKQIYDILAQYMCNMEISISTTLGHLSLREDLLDTDVAEELQQSASSAGTPELANYRLVSSTPMGIMQEIQSVTCGKHVAGRSPVIGASASGSGCSSSRSTTTASSSFMEGGEDGDFAIFTTSNVDVDERHPYVTSERVRKDISAVITLSSFRRSARSSTREQRKNKDWGDKNERCRGLEADGSTPKTELVVVMKRCAFITLHRPAFEISDPAIDELRANIHVWGDVMLKYVNDVIHAPSVPAL